MNKFLCLVFLCFFTTGFSQELYNTQNIQVTLADLNASAYSKDTTAHAIFIFENGYSRFQETSSFNLLTDYSAKIKIFDTKGYKHSQVVIPLYKNKSSSEKIHKLEASTYYLENGMLKSLKLDPNDIFTEENETYDLVKFTFPNLSPGVVLVYSYQKESPFIFNFEPWHFQDEIPKLYSNYETRIPANFNYNIKKVGELELDTHESSLKKSCYNPLRNNSPADCVVSQYSMRDIPAFVEEPYLTAKSNFISRIDFELKEMARFDGLIKKYSKTWEDVDRELKNDKNIGKQLGRGSLVKDLLPLELQQKPNDLAKAREIYEFVKKNYTWNGKYQIFRDMNLKDVIKEKTGNVTGINILLHNILEEQGFKVLPVMGSTRSNGAITQVYPVLSEFNYLMVQLETGQEKYLLDATEKNLDFGYIPFRSLNQYARLLDAENGSSWLELEPAGFSSISIRDSLVVNADGTSSGRSEQIYTGYHALQLRDKLEKISNDDIFGAAVSPGKYTKAGLTSLRNREEVSKELYIDHQLLIDSQRINDAIYLNPFNFLFFNKNPLQLKERHYPIDFGYKDAYTYSINIQIPENFSVVELPAQKLLRLPQSGGSLNFLTQQADDRNILVHCRISFPKATYASGYYPYLKEFFDAIIEVQSQSLIVMKENI